MKFDPYSWAEVSVNAEITPPPGRIRARCDHLSAWYVTAQGYEVLAGVGYDVDLTLSDEATLRAQASSAARVFMYVGQSEVFEPDGEVFTNADRKPHESGAMMEVKRALREMELKHKTYMDEQQAIALRNREAAAAETPAPDPEPSETSTETVDDVDDGAGEA